MHTPDMPHISVFRFLSILGGGALRILGEGCPVYTGYTRYENSKLVSRNYSIRTYCTSSNSKLSKSNLLPEAEESNLLCRLIQRKASEYPDERRNPTKVCSKNPENSMRVRSVLILKYFIILNVVPQIGDGTSKEKYLKTDL